jgi:HK97 family phage major capsid protein
MKEETKLGIAEAVKEAVSPILEKLSQVEAQKEVAHKEVAPVLSEKAKLANFIKGMYELKKFNNPAVLENVTGKSVNTLTDGAGGYAVPEGWARGIEKVMNDFGVARRVTRLFPMPTVTYNMPKRATSASVTWETEGAVINGSEPTFGNTQLVAKKLTAGVVLTNESIMDMNENMVEWVSADMGESISGEEDNQFLNGTGSPFTGVLAGATEVVMASGDTSFADVSAEYLIDVKNAVPHQHRAGSSWIMSDSVFGLIQKLKTTDGIPLYQTLGNSDNGTLLGYPVVLSSKAPSTSDDAVDTSFIAFGRFDKAVVLGQYKSLSFKLGTEGTFDGVNLLEADSSAVIAVERIAMAIAHSELIARLTTAAS